MEDNSSWDVWVSANGSGNIHLDVIKYMQDNGCPYDNTIENNLSYLGIVNYLRENGAPWDVQAINTEIERIYENIPELIGTKFHLIDEVLLQDVERQLDVSKIYTSEMCSICMSSPSNIILMPCEHKCCCSDCYEKGVKQHCICPICRHDVERMIIS